jgi:hypothetical protein
MGVAGGNGDNNGVAHGEELADDRPAFLVRILVGEYEDFVVLAFRQGRGKFSVQLL